MTTYQGGDTKTCGLKYGTWGSNTYNTNVFDTSITCATDSSIDFRGNRVQFTAPATKTLVTKDSTETDDKLAYREYEFAVTA